MIGFDDSEINLMHTWQAKHPAYVYGHQIKLAVY